MATIRHVAAACSSAVRRVWPALLVATLISACGNAPPTPVDATTTEPEVSDSGAAPAPPKIDILWVLQDSHGMCRSQRDLTKAYAAFASRLNKVQGIDVQMAVITDQQAPDKTVAPVVGRFRHHAAQTVSIHCPESVRVPCHNDAECSNPPPFTSPGEDCYPPCHVTASAKQLQTLAQGKWRCGLPQYTEDPFDPDSAGNPNCSINTYCEAVCEPGAAGDQACCDRFEGGKDCTARCTGGGIAPGDGVCLIPPDTAHCPAAADTPAVIAHTQADAFRCIANIAPSTTQEAKFEGGMRAAWKALDPKGPNCDYQACVDSLRSCCTTGAKWCNETKPSIIALNKKKCEMDKATICEHLTPYGACKREIAACCKGPHDLACSEHKDAQTCEAEVKGKCAGLVGLASVVPEACQNSRLLRDDARLLVVFISRDDDCSMHLDLHPHDASVMTKEIWEKCSMHNDSQVGNRWLAAGHCRFKQNKSAAGGKTMYCPGDCAPGCATIAPDGTKMCPNGCKEGSPERKSCLDKVAAQMAIFDQAKAGFYKYKSNKEHLAGWQFAPPATWALRLKTLKADFDQVYVAVVVGDSMAAETQQKERERRDFYGGSKADMGPGQMPFMCAGSRGTARLGARYLRLAELFGSRGLALNICQGETLAPALEAIADLVTGGLQ